MDTHVSASEFQERIEIVMEDLCRSSTVENDVMERPERLPMMCCCAQ